LTSSGNLGYEPVMTLLDRYLLGRYAYVFLVGYVALFGLYFVIDVFTNVGDFLDLPGGLGVIVTEILKYYSYRSCAFFGSIGGSMLVIAGMTTLALLQKYGELYPVLAAGVSTIRLLRPIVIGAVVVNGLIVLNQELVIPRIALQLQQDAGHQNDATFNVEPAIDFSADITIAGQRLNLRKRSLEGAEFVLRETRVATVLTPVTAKEAVSIEPGPDQPAGWLLSGFKPPLTDLPLTEFGRTLIRPGPEPDTLFVRTDITFDQLYRRDSSFEYLSTRELINRVQNPSYNYQSLRSQSMYLHSRLTKPIMNLVVLLVGVPFIVRKESSSLLKNVGMCASVLGVMFGCNEAFGYLAKFNLLTPESAAWAPIILWGGFATWSSLNIKT
jgi:lipopolysaccharide export system permease protein